MSICWRSSGLVGCIVTLAIGCAPDSSAAPSRTGSTTAAAAGAAAVSGGTVTAASGANGTATKPPSQGDNSTSLIVSMSAAAGSGAAADCSDAAKLIYTVDQDGRFSSFNPATNPPTFTDITPMLSCPAKRDFFGLPQSPFSMSVDRDAAAWVLYTSGELFRVDTAQGSCKSTMFQPNQAGFQLMGMGFVANDPGSNRDTLFVAGGEGPNTGSGSRLGTVDMSTLAITPAGALDGWPELTGTGLAELWGFYPDTTPPKVAKINKQTGAEDVVFPLATLQGTPAAWAFAFWGGDFWVFLMRTDDTDTTVYRVDGKTGMMSTALANTGRHIVGAGVSTCAPVSLL